MKKKALGHLEFPWSTTNLSAINIDWRIARSVPVFVRVDGRFLRRLWCSLSILARPSLLRHSRLLRHASFGSAGTLLGGLPVRVVHDAVMRLRDPLAIHYRRVVGAAFEGGEVVVDFAVSLDPGPIMWAAIVAVDGGDMPGWVGSRLYGFEGRCIGADNDGIGQECRREGWGDEEEKSRVSRW